jgi:GDP-D-mannose 3', 5'-epimerase
LKFHEFSETEADDFVVGDLRDQGFCRAIVDRRFDEVYQLAADMGGAGYIFTGEHDAGLMHNSATTNLNMLDACYKRSAGKIFYSSSACMYPAYNQEDPRNPKCAEDSAYPAAPDSEYGWEKLFSERLYLAYRRNYGMQTYIARHHNIFGPEGTWTGGREKAPAAICRKVAMARDGEKIEKYGETVSRLARFSTSTSVWKARCGCFARILPVRSISGRRRWSRSTNSSISSRTSPPSRSARSTSAGRWACAGATRITG